MIFTFIQKQPGLAWDLKASEWFNITKTGQRYFFAFPFVYLNLEKVKSAAVKKLVISEIVSKLLHKWYFCSEFLMPGTAISVKDCSSNVHILQSYDTCIANYFIDLLAWKVYLLPLTFWCHSQFGRPCKLPSCGQVI